MAAFSGTELLNKGQRGVKASCPIKMVTLPPGNVKIGESRILIQSFKISEVVITQRQWFIVSKWSKVKKELDPHPSFFKGDDLPVEQISWEDAMEFCDRLTANKGIKHILPTEIQWEYACRAGTNTAFSFGDKFSGKFVNCFIKGVKEEDIENCTLPVRSFPPNRWGLYEMHGNVAEWCLDNWSQGNVKLCNGGKVSTRGGTYVVRGGGWHSLPEQCASGARIGVQSLPEGCSDVGFRVVSSW